MTQKLKEKLLKEYSEKEELYKEFSSLIRNLLYGFLMGQESKFQISHRAKEKDKLAEKINRKKEEGKVYNKLDDIEDLAGVRVVFYLESDKKRFLSLFIDEFRDCIVSQEEKYDPKGYRGTHIIFRFDNKRSDLIEYRRYKGLKCELQISTILFHAWSEVERIVYKPQGEKKMLKALGLDDLEKGFQEMVQHIQTTTLKFDHLNKRYEAIKKAGEILGSDFLANINLAKSNDDIYEILEAIESFYYKKPEETLAIVSTIIGKKPLSPVLLSNSGGYKIYGKTHKELIIKCLELLEDIRYFKPDEVLQLLSNLSLNNNKDIHAKALEITKKFAEYNYNVLKKSKIGYGAQRKILDFILVWSHEDQLRYIDFVETAIKELLSSSFEGSEWTKEDTITMHSGAVAPTDFLKKMRRETIDLIYKLYKTTGDSGLRLRLVNILDEATRTPSNVVYGDDVAQMIIDDVRYLTGIYRKMIFGEAGDKMTDDLGIVGIIEKRLYWINRSEKRKIEESEKLREDILRDDLYKLFRLLVGDPLSYKEEEGWDVAEQKLTEEINALIGSVTEAQFDLWFDKFDKVAKQHVIVDEWQFNTFKLFIRKLSETKPQVAEKLLERAFRDGSSLKHFTSSFLDGFRDGTHFAQWDKFVNEIIGAKDTQLISAIVFSLNLLPGADLKEMIRDYDLEILKDIVKREGKLSFLKGIDDRILHYALINTLGRNFERSPERIEPLIIEEIQNNPKHVNMFFMQLPMIVHSKWFDIKDLGQEIVDLIREKMIEIPKMDWHVQELLLAIGERDGLSAVLDVFMKRIEKDEQRTGKRRIDERYEVIPYHFNPDLDKFIAEHADYKEIVSGWVAKMTTYWSIYNWNVSHFLQRIGGRFGDILTSLIQRGGDDNLMKAARAMHSIDHIDFDICIDIIRKTDNKRVIDQVASNMYTTGVVSGEYGLVEAYEKKVIALRKYEKDENERVKKFVEQMIKSFNESANRERQRADEEKELRKIEFDG